MTGNFQVSSKLPDGRIFVVASETYTAFCEALESTVGIEESQAVLQQMAQSLLGAPSASVQAVQNITAAFPGATVDHTAHPVTGGSSLGPTSKTCKHGEMSKRTGAGAKGPWKAFMCPSPKGTVDQCEPVWIRRHEPEWNTF
jgi:hypothetical protein